MLSFTCCVSETRAPLLCTPHRASGNPNGIAPSAKETTRRSNGTATVSLCVLPSHHKTTSLNPYSCLVRHHDDFMVEIRAEALRGLSNLPQGKENKMDSYWPPMGSSHPQTANGEAGTYAQEFELQSWCCSSSSSPLEMEKHWIKMALAFLLLSALVLPRLSTTGR